MLIISRRKGQRIVIGHDLEVIVTDLSRSTVKLGIKAPTQTVVMRGEVRDSIEAANREAASSPLELTLELTRGPRTPEPPRVQAASAMTPAALPTQPRTARVAPSSVETAAPHAEEPPDAPHSAVEDPSPAPATATAVEPTPTVVRRPVGGLGGLEVIRRRPRG